MRVTSANPTQMLRAPAARGAHKKGYHFWIPLYNRTTFIAPVRRMWRGPFSLIIIPHNLWLIAHSIPGDENTQRTEHDVDFFFIDFWFPNTASISWWPYGWGRMISIEETTWCSDHVLNVTATDGGGHSPVPRRSRFPIGYLMAGWGVGVGVTSDFETWRPWRPPDTIDVHICCHLDPYYMQDMME
jgi:hypothetical protein